MRLAALCETDPTRAALLEKAYGLPVYPDYRDMFRSGRLNAVIVATPHYSHCEIAAQALGAGLHVLVEKPLGVRLSEAKRLCAAAEATDRVFAIMYNQRTDSLFRRVKELLDAGRLGKVKKAVWVITNWYRTQAYYDSGTWRATWAGEGGGILMNQAPHQLDLWQWLFGMPDWVTVRGSIAKYHHIEVEDDVTVIMEYSGGMTGILTASTGEFPGTNRLEISGTGGKLVLEDGKLKLWALAEDEEGFRFRAADSFAAIPLNYREEEAGPTVNGHLRILNNFAGGILRGEQLIAPGTDGIYEVTLANAAYLSMWTGCPTALPFEPAEYDRLLERFIMTSHKKSGGTGIQSLCDGYRDRWAVRW